jgi:Asp-tRNA(Asn)/Glu-tRNA(Gln) amidotransferase C subunit
LVSVAFESVVNYFKEMNEVENDDIEIVIYLNEDNHDDVLNAPISQAEIKISFWQSETLVCYAYIFRQAMGDLQTCLILSVEKFQKNLKRVDNRLMCLWMNYFKEMNEVEHDHIKIVINLNEDNHDDVLSSLDLLSYLCF